MSVDIEIDDRKSHLNDPCKVIWKRARISPIFEKPIIEIDSFLELGQVRSPPHLTEEFSFIKLEGLALFKIGAGLDRPDSKTKFRESATIGIGDMEMNFSLHMFSFK
jgi:hypothetical protein